MNSEKLLALCREKRRRGEKNIANNIYITWLLCGFYGLQDLGIINVIDAIIAKRQVEHAIKPVSQQISS